MEISLEKRDDDVILSPLGDVDLSSSRELQQTVKRAMEDKPQRLIVNLTDVPYMDSSGVATLVEAMQIARKQSTRLVLCCMQSKVRSIFEIARLDRVFTIVDDLESASTA